MIRWLGLLWRAIFHVSGAMFVHVSPAGVLVVPAVLVIGSGGFRRGTEDGWTLLSGPDELDRYLAELLDRCLSHLAELER